VNSAQSEPASILIVGSHMLDSVSDDAKCATSLAPLMDLVDILKARSHYVRAGSSPESSGEGKGHCLICHFITDSI